MLRAVRHWLLQVALQQQQLEEALQIQQQHQQLEEVQCPW
jgi:hypothetical protein